MAYFREFPNINYVSLLPDRNKNEERILVKNIFKRAKLRSDIKFGITMFERYQVEENMRPEAIANRIYQDPELDWVILLVNNITNIRYSHSNYSQFDFARCRRREAFRRLRRLELRGTNC